MVSSASSLGAAVRTSLRPFRRPYLKLRNSILGHPGFQRWAAWFPLTRMIARFRARRVFDMVAGFVYSQVLFACVQTGVLEYLEKNGPSSLDDLAQRMAMPRENALLLIKAAISLGLIDEDGRGFYMLGPQGAEMSANPGIAAMVRHHAMLYEDLLDPVALLRGPPGGKRLGAYWAYAGDAETRTLDASRVADYTELMSLSQARVTEEILDAFDPKGFSRWMDLGGGNATFLSAVGRRHPHLELMLFDLPAVAERAQERFAQLGLADRASTFGGDFFRDPLPSGADLISLVRVVHDHNDDEIQGLFQSIRRSLPDNGALLIAEPMSGTPGAEPVGDAYFGLYLFAMGKGRPRTPAELESMLRQAGFSRVRMLTNRTPLLTRVMLAQV